MTVVTRFSLVAALLLSLAGPAFGDDKAYRTAYGLHADCVAGENGRDATAAERFRRCAGYIGRIFNNWNLNQRPGISSKHVGRELPGAYLNYWRGMDFLSGTFIGARRNRFVPGKQRRSLLAPRPERLPQV